MENEDDKFIDNIIGNIGEMLDSQSEQYDEISERIIKLQIELFKIKKEFVNLKNYLDFEKIRLQRVNNKSKENELIDETSKKKTDNSPSDSAEAKSTIIEIDENSEKTKSDLDTQNISKSSVNDINQDNNYNELSPIAIKYCSNIAGNGFDVADLTDDINMRSVFAIEIINENTARFYPLHEKSSRILQNPDTMLRPMCDFDKSALTSSSFNINKEDYGLLRLEEGNHWSLLKPCILH